MKNWKRMLSLVLALAMISMTVAGCNGGGEDVDPNVTVLQAWSSQVHSAEVVTAYVEKMNDTVFKDAGIKLEYSTYGNDYGKTLDMAIANDSGPDLFSGSVSTYAKKHQITALEDVEGGQELLDMYPDEAAASDKIKIPGVDVAKTYSLIITYVTYGMVYNRDLFKEAGIVNEAGEAKAPKTWAEVREAAAKITDPKKGTYGIMFPFKWSAYVGNELTGAWTPSGAQREDGGFRETFKYVVEDNEVNMLEWWLSIRDDGSYYPGPEGIDNDPARATFSTGVVGMKAAASWDVSNFNGMFNCEFDWGVIPYPVYDENAPIMTQGLSTNSFLSVANYISDERKAQCITVLKSLCSKDMQQLLYESCMAIPTNPQAIADATFDESSETYLKGWKEFAEMTAFSEKSPAGPSVTVPGDSTQALYLKVWSGQMSIEDAVNDKMQRSQAALDEAVAHGDVLLDDFRDGWQRSYLTDEQKAIRAAYFE